MKQQEVCVPSPRGALHLWVLLALSPGAPPCIRLVPTPYQCTFKLLFLRSGNPRTLESCMCLHQKHLLKPRLSQVPCRQWGSLLGRRVLGTPRTPPGHTRAGVWTGCCGGREGSATVKGNHSAGSLLCTEGPWGCARQPD